MKTTQSERELRRSRPGRERLRSGLRPLGGATKSRFPAEARYWGRINTQGDFEEALTFPTRRLAYVWQACARTLRKMAPLVVPAFVGAVTALIVQGLVLTRTRLASAPTIIVNPAAATAAPVAAPAVAPVPAGEKAPAPALKPEPGEPARELARVRTISSPANTPTIFDRSGPWTDLEAQPQTRPRAVVQAGRRASHGPATLIRQPSPADEERAQPLRRSGAPRAYDPDGILEPSF